MSTIDSDNKYVKRCFFCISLHLKVNDNLSRIILMSNEDNLSLEGVQQARQYLDVSDILRLMTASVSVEQLTKAI